jgi:hypothetical protein
MLERRRLRQGDAAGQRDLGGGRLDGIVGRRDPAAVDQQVAAVGVLQRGDDVQSATPLRRSARSA